MMGILYYNLNFHELNLNLQMMIIMSLIMQMNLKHCLDFIYFVTYVLLIYVIIEVYYHRQIA